MSEDKTVKFELKPADNSRLALLCGQHDTNFLLLEKSLGVIISNRGHHFNVTGIDEKIYVAKEVLHELYELTKKQTPLTPEQIHLVLQTNRQQEKETFLDYVFHTKVGVIKGRGKNQRQYIHNIFTYDLNFGVGPAGTGKTYLAVAAAVDALKKDKIARIILVRPAVEAGERLGFLPGDLAQKVDPYLRPLYDALYEMLGFEQVHKLLERNVIEIAPLAYMRGRTLNDAFIILDESQNTTKEQMKMFLTRIGFGSTVVVTGDITQVDLVRTQESGLKYVIDILKNIGDISFTFFTAKDVVRHPLVQIIIEAYERYEK